MFIYDNCAKSVTKGIIPQGFDATSGENYLILVLSSELDPLFLRQSTIELSYRLYKYSGTFL